MPPADPAQAEKRAEGQEVEDDELTRLKASAGAAWLLNLVLVVWLAWLYRNRPTNVEEDTGTLADKEAIASLLSKQLEEESKTLRSDQALKEELQQQAATMASIARRVEALKPCTGAAYQSRGACPAKRCVWQPSATSARQEEGACKDIRASESYFLPVLKELREQVSSEQATIERREAELINSLQQTQTSLKNVYERARLEAQRVETNAVLGPLSTLSSGALASMDVSVAVETMSMALLISLATRSWGQQREPGSADAKGTGAQSLNEELKSQTVLRFYGRWDDQKEWLLLRSLRLEGTASKVIGAVRSSRSWLGSVSDSIITALVTRSARGIVERRGWKTIVEQTQREVGRTFVLGYLVETVADKASPRIPTGCKDSPLQEIPSASLLVEKK